MAKQYYEFKDKTSRKFWEIDTKGKTVTVRFGKIATDGQTTVKTFASPTEATAHAGKVTAAKVKKGYRKAVAGGSAGSRKSKAKTGRVAKVAKQVSASELKLLAAMGLRPCPNCGPPQNIYKEYGVWICSRCGYSSKDATLPGVAEVPPKEASRTKGKQSGSHAAKARVPVGAVLSFHGCVEYDVEAGASDGGGEGWVVWGNKCGFTAELKFPKNSASYLCFAKHRIWDTELMPAHEIEYGNSIGRSSERYERNPKGVIVTTQRHVDPDEPVGSVCIAADRACLDQENSHVIFSDGSKDSGLFHASVIRHLTASARALAKPPEYGPKEYLRYLVQGVPLTRKKK